MRNELFVGVLKANSFWSDPNGTPRSNATDNANRIFRIRISGRSGPYLSLDATKVTRWTLFRKRVPVVRQQTPELMWFWRLLLDLTGSRTDCSTMFLYPITDLD